MLQSAHMDLYIDVNVQERMIECIPALKLWEKGKASTIHSYKTLLTVLRALLSYVIPSMHKLYLIFPYPH